MREVFLGTDLVDVREVESALQAFGERYLARVYTPAEIAYALASPPETARRLAARFAVKEATLKALHAGEVGVDPRSIEVTKSPDGACGVALSGAAALAARRAGAGPLAVSISHEGCLAIAVVVGERAAPPKSRLSTHARKPGAHRR
jgi:holo-[acyl-carrier protein] synthase